MRIIYGPAGSGKTMQLIRIAAKHNYYMVVKDMEEARRVNTEAHKLGFNIPFPLTYREFLEGEYYKQGIKWITALILISFRIIFSNSL